MTKVYVLNRGGYDYSAAESFGTLVYCTDGPLKKYDISQMFRLMKEALIESSGEDYILLTSLSSLCSIACAIFAARHKRLNLLIYRRGVYYEHQTVFDEAQPEASSRNSPAYLPGQHDDL